jgi:hypothetical protein
MESERMPDMQLAPQSLEGLDVPGVAPMLDDMSAANKANNSFQALRSGRTLNLRNQNTPLNQIRRDDILTAAQDSIAGMQEAEAAEAMARRAAGAAAVGGGLMIADTLTRGATSRQPTTANMPMELEQAGDPMAEEYAPETAAPPGLSDFMAPDVELLPVEDAPVTNDYMSMALPTDLMSDDPMATADLAMESRPLPESTPRVAMTGAQAAEEIMADARAQIERLNSYRRSGQITPQVDRQMTQEIQRMMQLVNEARSGR